MYMYMYIYTYMYICMSVLGVGCMCISVAAHMYVYVNIYIYVHTEVRNGFPLRNIKLRYMLANFNTQRWAPFHEMLVVHGDLVPTAPSVSRHASWRAPAGSTVCCCSTCLAWWTKSFFPCFPRLHLLPPGKNKRSPPLA